MEDKKTFADLGLSKETLEALETKGYQHPTKIQELAIPLVLETTTHIFGQSSTGTGKTAAFGLPILERIDPKLRKPQVLVLAPTRELALQITKELESFATRRNIKISAIYGGQSFGEQARNIRDSQVIVATPGRMIDHLTRGTVSINDIGYLVLDEADEMLNMGFIDDINEILEHIHDDVRFLLFSATLPNELKTIIKKYMPEYEHIKVAPATNSAETLIEQLYLEVKRNNKLELLSRFIEVNDDFYGIIFCNMKVEVDSVATELIKRGIRAEGLHGDCTQAHREKALLRFKNKASTILVATDVAARGIDISDLTHVINFHVPDNPESYIHRIGRTGRAGKKGVALTLVSPEERRDFEFIKKIAKSEVKRATIETKDIIAKRKHNLLAKLQQSLADTHWHSYREFSDDILKLGEPQDVLSALMKLVYNNTFILEEQNNIEDLILNEENSAELFVAVGMEQNTDKQEIIMHIMEVSGVDEKAIKSVKILNKCSYVRVDNSVVNTILDAFRKIVKKGEKPLISLAHRQQQTERESFSPRRGGGGRSSGRREGGSYGGRREGSGRRDGGSSYGRRDGGNSGRREDRGTERGEGNRGRSRY